jgi:hypothetical protein
MPDNYKVLSHLMFLAQQMLLPRSDSVTIPGIGPPSLFKNIDVKEIIEVSDPETVWLIHYTKFKRTSL